MKKKGGDRYDHRGGGGGQQERPLLLFAVVGALLVCVSMMPLTVSAQGNWEDIPIDGNKPEPRLYAASSNNAPLPPPYDPDERTGLVIFGGTNDTEYQGAFFGDVWILNVQDAHNDGRVWTMIEIEPSTEAPAPRCLSAIAVETQTMTMYMYGGFNGTNWFSDFWSLDLSAVQYPGTTVHWNFLGSDMGPPQMCGMSLVYCPIYTGLSRWSLLMFGGGYGKRQLYNTLWSYDIESSSWFKFDPSEGGEAPSPREFFGAYCFPSGDMVVFGGNDYDYDSYNDTHVLVTGSTSSASTEWISVGQNNIAPNARGSLAGTAYNDNSTILIYGGRDDYSVYNDVWLFSDLSYWTSLNVYTTGPDGRYGSASGLSNSKLFPGLIVVGGADSSGAVHNDVWIYAYQKSHSSSTSGAPTTGGRTSGGGAVTTSGGEPTTTAAGGGPVTTAGGQTSGGGPVTTEGGGPSTAAGQTAGGYSSGGQTVSTAGQTAGGYSSGGQTGGESTGGQIHRGGSRV